MHNLSYLMGTTSGTIETADGLGILGDVVPAGPSH